MPRHPGTPHVSAPPLTFTYLHTLPHTSTHLHVPCTQASFVGATALTDMIKTTLGPKGMDKILLSMSDPKNMQVTNDGATILKGIYLDNPAAKVLVDISNTTDKEVGDGTTSVCVLAGELLREAEKLVNQKIHPQVIIDGWRASVQAALDVLEHKCAQNYEADSAALREAMLSIARTTLSSKILSGEKEKFAEIAVDAVTRIKGGSLDHIHIIKKQGGSLKSSYLEEGYPARAPALRRVSVCWRTARCQRCV